MRLLIESEHLQDEESPEKLESIKKTITSTLGLNRMSPYTSTLQRISFDDVHQPFNQAAFLASQPKTKSDAVKVSLSPNEVNSNNGNFFECLFLVPIDVGRDHRKAARKL